MDIMDYKLPGEKKSKKKKKPTLRFELDLPDSTDVSCPEYSYVDLVRQTLKERESKGQNDDLCQNLLEEEEEKERNEAKAIAEYYEIKYGATAAGQKRKRKDKGRDLVGAGYGYDENDPFVDDSEAYDEIVPASLTTQHGGFYINIGKLNFRTVSDDSDSDAVSSDDSMPLVHHVGKKKKTSHMLETDESGNEFQAGNEVKKKKKKLKQAKDRATKKRKMSLNGKDKVPGLKQRAKKIKKPTSLAQKLIAKAKAQQMMNVSGSPVHPSNGAIPQFRKLSEERPTVKSLSGELGHLESNDLAQVAKQVTKELMSVGSTKVSPERDSNLENGINPSTTPQSSGSKNPSTVNHELPPNLPQKLGDKIESLKKIAKSTEVAGKMKFFSSDVNRILLGIEESAQVLRNKERQGMYHHIAQHLPCSKDTLLKRVKKLQEDDSDQQLRGPIQRLKAAVDAVMTSQIEAYVLACDAKTEKFPPDKTAPSTDEDEENEDRGADSSAGEKAKRQYAPRRKFKWDDNLRKLLCDVVSVKMNLYERFKLRERQNAEEYLKAFLESSIKPLWPKPWMQTRILFKESRSVHERLTLNCQKPKKAGSSKKVPNISKDNTKASESSSSCQRVAMSSQTATAQNDTAAKVFKKLNFENSDNQNPSSSTTSKSSSGIIDLTSGGGFELVASIEGDDFTPQKKNNITSQSKGAARTTPKEIQSSWKPVTPNSKTKTLQKQSSFPVSTAAAGKTDSKTKPPASNKTIEPIPDYAPDFLNLMISSGQGLQGPPGFLGMPGHSNYDALYQILGLKPDDVMSKSSSKKSDADGKFQFKISQSPTVSTSKSDHKGGFPVTEIGRKLVPPTLDPSTWATKKATSHKALPDEDIVKSMGSKSVTQISPGRSAPTSFSDGLVSQHHSVQSTSSNFQLHPGGSSKFTNQRQKKSAANSQSPKNSQTNFEASAQIQKLATSVSGLQNMKQHSSPMSHVLSPSPYHTASPSVQSPVQQITPPLAGIPSISLSARSGQYPASVGNSFSAPFTRPPFPPVTSFKTPQSPVHNFPSSPMSITGHPFAAHSFTNFPQVQLVDIQRNKDSPKQANMKMEGNRR